MGSKKVGIVTIIDNDNYGNRLQNYAVQEIIKTFGFQIETLQNRSYSNSKKRFIQRCIRYGRKSSTYSANQNRKKNFEKFNEKILFSKKIYTPFSKSDHDYVVVGSDQVWNPHFRRLSDVDLLNFVEPEKRIAVSASFGVDKLPNTCESDVSKEMRKFKAISVREEQAKHIVDELTGKNSAVVVIDPTMMLSAEQWNDVLTEPSCKNTDYILCYFLGEPSEKQNSEINRTAEENGCEIINILDHESAAYESGPSEFLGLIKNARLICTDSFHASVFSILFHRPFVVFGREGNAVKMSSRIDTLLKTFGLTNHVFENQINAKNLQCDFNGVDEQLTREREKFKSFLKAAFDD